MANDPHLDSSGISTVIRRAIHEHWRLFLAEGVILVILGTLAVLAPTVASIAATVLFGWILLVSGAVGLYTTIRARRAPGFTWSLVSALTALVAGALLLVWPLQGTLSLTAVLIAFLALEGVVSILYALDHRKGLSGRWGWMLASGIVDLILAGIILAGLPGTALWALGLIIGINMIFGGWALVAMALHARASSGVV
ncbi:MAG TPA: HdeD family acid-resistance protein [Steroidobacteraceae bacterium]|nr:HdeD family acid-resistance protein [Steroidobacteraceae bacterium]